jgi:hypothetical protein
MYLAGRFKNGEKESGGITVLEHCTDCFLSYFFYLLDLYHIFAVLTCLYVLFLSFFSCGHTHIEILTPSNEDSPNGSNIQLQDVNFKVPKSYYPWFLSGPVLYQSWQIVLLGQFQLPSISRHSNPRVQRSRKLGTNWSVMQLLSHLKFATNSA